MNFTNYFIFKFLFGKIKNSIITGLILGIILFLFLGKDILVQYIVGFLLGIINFSLLTIGMDLILTLQPKFVRIIHFLFFAFRYLIITVVIVEYILHRKANPFVVVGGLLTMNFSIFVFEMKKHLLSRKEG